MAQFAKRFRLDLTDTLPCDVKFLSDLLKSARPAVHKPEAELQHLLLSRCQRVKHLVQLLVKKSLCRRISRSGCCVVLYEISDRHFKRDGIL